MYLRTLKEGSVYHFFAEPEHSATRQDSSFIEEVKLTAQNMHPGKGYNIFKTCNQNELSAVVIFDINDFDVKEL